MHLRVMINYLKVHLLGSQNMVTCQVYTPQTRYPIPVADSKWCYHHIPLQLAIGLLGGLPMWAGSIIADNQVALCGMQVI